MSALETYYANKKKASPVLQEQILRELTGEKELAAKHSPGFFMQLLDILDRPANATRALLIGKLGGLKGMFPFAQVIEDLTGLDIAINKDERITGVQVIEKWFGKQKQRKGKIDPVDVLGLLVEIVFDPLWLFGGLTLTKAGRAAKMVRSAIRGASNIPDVAKSAEALNNIRMAIKAVRAGKPITAKMSKKLARAIRYTYTKGKGPKRLAVTWAEQAARGERKLLSFGLPYHRKTVIKGVKVFKAAGKASMALKTGPLGKLFRVPARRVSVQYMDELHDIINHFGRDLPDKEAHEFYVRASKLYKDLGDPKKADKLNELITRFVEADLAKFEVSKRIANIKNTRLKQVAPAVAKARKEMEKLYKRAQANVAKLDQTKYVPKSPKPVRPVSVGRGEPVVDVAKAKARIAVLKKEIKTLLESQGRAGGLTKTDANEYRKLFRELSSLRYDVSRGKPLGKLKPVAEGMSFLDEAVIRQAQRDLRKNKAVYLAINDAAAGVGFGEDTAIDLIMKGANPNISADEFYRSFEKTRRALKQKYGDTITLYRAESGMQKAKATTNWTTSRELAEQYGKNIITKEVPIDEIAAVNVGLRGNYHEVIVAKKIPTPKAAKPRKPTVILRDPRSMPKQVIKDADVPRLNVLEKDIRRRGITQPIIFDPDQQKVLDGAKRLRIAQDKGFDSIKVKWVKEADWKAGKKAAKARAAAAKARAETTLPANLRIKTGRAALVDINRKIKAHPVYLAAQEPMDEVYGNLWSRMGKEIDFGRDFGNFEKHMGKTAAEADLRKGLWRYVRKPSMKGNTTNFLQSAQKSQPWDQVADELMKMADDFGVQVPELTNVDSFIEFMDETARYFGSAKGGINERALQVALESNDLTLDLLNTKRIAASGGSLKDVDAATIKWAKFNDIDVEDVAMELYKRPKTLTPTAAYRKDLKKWRWQQAREKAKVAKKRALLTAEQRRLEKEIAKKRRFVTRKFNVATNEDIASIQHAYERGRIMEAEAAKVLDEAAQVAPEGAAKVKAAAQQIAKESEAMLAREAAVGLKVSPIDQLLGYMRRGLTDEARKFLADEKMNQRFLAQGQKILRAKHGSMTRRSAAIGSLSRPEVDDIFKQLGFKGKHVFEPGAVQGKFARELMHTRSVGAAKAINEAIRKFTKPAAYFDNLAKQGKEVTERWMPLTQFINEAQLNPAQVEKILGRSIADRMIPREIAKALTATRELTTNPEAYEGLSKLVTNIQRYMKGAFTVPFPAYHGRNMISNVFLNWIAGVVDPAAYYKAAQLQKAAIATRRIMRKQNILWDDALKQTMHMWPTIDLGTGVSLHGSQFWQMADEWGVTGRSLGIMAVEETAGPNVAMAAKNRLMQHLTGTSPGWQRARSVAVNIEDNARLAHFIDKTQKGFGPQAAARSMKKVLFDYGDLSDFEKKVMRDKVFFFYTFARKNLSLQVKTLFEQPAKQALFAHLAGGTPVAGGVGKQYPKYWQERLTVPLPIRSKEGKQYVVSGTGLPFEEAFGPLAAPGTGIGKRLQRLVSRQASRLNPLASGGMELATGHNLYFDAPIDDLGQWAVQKSPFGRIYGTVKHTLESPDRPGSKALGFLTGLRYKTYEPGKMAESHLRRISREYLERQKQVRMFKRFYTKEPNVPAGVEFALENQ